MRLSCNQYVSFSMLIAALLLVVNQAFSFGIHGQPITAQPHHLQKPQLAQPNHGLFKLPRVKENSKRLVGGSSLNQSNDMTNQNKASRVHPRIISFGLQDLPRKLCSRHWHWHLAINFFSPALWLLQLPGCQWDGFHPSSFLCWLALAA